ncbi:MAG TPA: hypothetical protein VK327_13070, partial [Candidatus Paceibacterota bacterium]|nr:hypothetical protein [Candidatus Paceibacterota bacterium]
MSHPIPARIWRPTIAMTILLAAQFNLNAENHWINASSGFWSTPANWSQNAIPDGSSGLDPTQITNAGTKTVTIDSATALGNLSLRGLIISAPIGATNTLRVDSAPATLTASKALLINNRGVLQITNSAVT